MTPARCVAHLADGCICGAPAEYPDDMRGGFVCAAHIPLLADPAVDAAIEDAIDENLEFEEPDLY